MGKKNKTRGFRKSGFWVTSLLSCHDILNNSFIIFFNLQDARVELDQWLKDQFGEKEVRQSSTAFTDFLRFSNVSFEEWVLPKQKFDNFISFPCCVFTTRNEIRSKLSENFLKKKKIFFFYLASFTRMNSIVKPRSFISTDTAFNCHEGVGRLFMRLTVQLSLFRIIRWGCRLHFDCTCVQKNVSR